MSSAVLKVIAIFAAIELLVVGGLGALAATRLGFPYAALTPISFLVYGLAGFSRRRPAARVSLQAAQWRSWTR